MLQVLLISIVLLSIAIAGFAIKMFFFRDAEFKKSCSSVDPTTGERYGCSCGSGDGGEACENKQPG
jgi:hypothetical protein